MKVLSLHIKFFILLLAMLAFSGIVFSQDKTLYINKGERKFTVRSHADYYEWYIDGSKQDGKTDSTFIYSWPSDTFKLSAVPFKKEGCPGDEYAVNLIVKDDVAKGDTQIVISSIDNVCAPSNAPVKQSPAYLRLELRAYNNPENPDEYTRIDNLRFAVQFEIDGEQKPFTKNDTLIDLNEIFRYKQYPVSNREVKSLRILKLSYGPKLDKQVDYTNSPNQPKGTFTITKLWIGEKIKVIED